MPKVKVTEMKRHLQTYDKKDLIRLIVELSKTSKEAQDYLAAEVQGEAAVAKLYEEAKQQIQNEFFPQKGNPKLRLAHAKKAISNFGKFTEDRVLKTDLMLYYVEMGTDFTIAYGDINEPFYNSMASVFHQVVAACNKDRSMLWEFGERLDRIYYDAGQVGWGYQEDLAGSYYTLEWPEGEKE